MTEIPDDVETIARALNMRLHNAKTLGQRTLWIAEAILADRARQAATPSPSSHVEVLEKALAKINDIRNSIIGCQKMNWSEHIYPLVAALNEAGIEGQDYPEAREYVGTMLERTLAAENEVITLQAQLRYIASQWPETSAGKYANSALATEGKDNG
ncbi:hypothetical protein [Agrobacterium sp. MS2]|uniref:hypothetical protein n=1 Tax=Agrobacterium sp. MS2 TaxID=1345498 RepID=UPI0011B93E5A|nr:hypothetical protein [Agrobacterium sp. MS2]